MGGVFFASRSVREDPWMVLLLHHLLLLLLLSEGLRMKMYNEVIAKSGKKMEKKKRLYGSDWLSPSQVVQFKFHAFVALAGLFMSGF